jgi:hypothetical protein
MLDSVSSLESFVLMYVTQTICVCPTTGSMYSFDRKAARLWSNNKQVKSIHWLEGQRKFYASRWIPAIDGVLVIFEYFTGEGDDSSSSRKTIIQIWNARLILVQEVL